MAVVVVQLARNATPPDGQDWVLVERDSLGKYASGDSIVRHGRSATFYVPDAALESELEAAIDKATSWAYRHEIGEVYVREGFQPDDKGGSPT